MKRLGIKLHSDLLFITGVFLTWRFYLEIARKAGEWLIPVRNGYLGFSPWANFDGVHYLSIARIGYQGFEQAFFPGFPLLIKIFGNIVGFTFAGLLVSNLSIFLSLFVFYKMVKSEFGQSCAWWSVLLLLSFPASFYFAALYTESFFLLLILSSFYFAGSKNILSGFFGGLASLTRLVGIFLLPALIISKKISGKYFLLLIPVGMLAYMVYLKFSYNDSLSFFHAQPAFGAGRSGDSIILLPQVIYRYSRIFLTVPLNNYDFWIAALEMVLFTVALAILLYGTIKKRVENSLLVFSWLALITPTLTGTLSSMPRYTLTIFPIFIIASQIKSTKIKLLWSIFSGLLLFILTMLFTRGYFVS